MHIKFKQSTNFRLLDFNNNNNNHLFAQQNHIPITGQKYKNNQTYLNLNLILNN
jgi:hypothetical protein